MLFGLTSVLKGLIDKHLESHGVEFCRQIYTPFEARALSIQVFEKFPVIQVTFRKNETPYGQTQPWIFTVKQRPLPVAPWEAEVAGWLSTGIPGQPGQHRETPVSKY